MKKTFKLSKYKDRITNTAIINLIILLWLLSRKISIIPFFVWDILRWMMMFFIVKLFLRNNLLKISIISLVICFWIEFSQLIQLDWLIDIRNTKIWWIILWKWFLYTDLVAYNVWIILSYILIKILWKQRHTSYE